MTGMGFNWQEDFKKEVAAMSGTGDGGGAWVAAGFGFEVKLVEGGMEEVHPSLYRDVGGV
jgi:hypothetical protein